MVHIKARQNDALYWQEFSLTFQLNCICNNGEKQVVQYLNPLDLLPPHTSEACVSFCRLWKDDFKHCQLFQFWLIKNCHGTFIIPTTYIICINIFCKSTSSMFTMHSIPFIGCFSFENTNTNIDFQNYGVLLHQEGRDPKCFVIICITTTPISQDIGIVV